MSVRPDTPRAPPGDFLERAASLLPSALGRTRVTQSADSASGVSFLGAAGSRGEGAVLGGVVLDCTVLGCVAGSGVTSGAWTLAPPVPLRAPSTGAGKKASSKSARFINCARVATMVP